MSKQKRPVPRAKRIEMEFLEGLRNRCPGNTHVLRALGDLYTRVGRIEEGLDVDIKLAELCPDESESWYNLGCSLALAGRKDEALEALSRAVDLGYEDADWMSKDSDLDSVRADPRFWALLRKVRG